MTRRKRTSPEIETEILVRSGRRCCICFGINGDFSEKRGQIAHLDKNPSNSGSDNLAFLCLEHHDLYDSRTSQSKGFALSEVKAYRSLLYEKVSELRAKINISTTPEEISESSVYFLPRIKTGKELVDVAVDSHFYVYNHDEPTNEQEADLLGHFLQEVIDSCEELGLMGPKVRIDTALYFNSKILELEENGFRVFGKREIEKKEVNKINDIWITSYISVIRNTNPTIIDLEEMRKNYLDIQ